MSDSSFIGSLISLYTQTSVPFPVANTAFIPLVVQCTSLFFSHDYFWEELVPLVQSDETREKSSSGVWSGNSWMWEWCLLKQVRGVILRTRLWSYRGLSSSRVGILFLGSGWIQEQTLSSYDCFIKWEVRSLLDSNPGLEVKESRKWNVLIVDI